MTANHLTSDCVNCRKLHASSVDRREELALALAGPNRQMARQGRVGVAFQESAFRIPNRRWHAYREQGGSISEDSPRRRGVFRFLFRNGWAMSAKGSSHSVREGIGTLRWLARTVEGARGGSGACRAGVVAADQVRRRTFGVVGVVVASALSAVTRAASNVSSEPPRRGRYDRRCSPWHSDVWKSPVSRRPSPAQRW